MTSAQSTGPTHRKPILGLTGGPGSGKSTVARLFAELGCGIIDADQLAHEALQQDAVLEQLVQWWGDAVLTGQGTVDRPAVGRVVFGNEAELQRLESVIHPMVHAGRAASREKMLADASVLAIIEDCPLLLESGLDDSCDAVVFVDCPLPVRLQRLQQSRGWDEKELQKREQHQIPLDIKRRSADYVVDNGEPIENVRSRVKQLLNQILGQAHQVDS